MIRKILFYGLIATVAFFGWRYVSERPELKSKIVSSVTTQQFRTFKARHTPEQIIAAHQKELLGSNVLEPKTLYYPHLLMDVKYSPQSKKKTNESVLLWGLIDGEMIKDTMTWKKTHGFEECLIAKTTAHEFAVLREVIMGASSKEKLHQKLVDIANVDDLVEACVRKKLLLEESDQLRLHFENPAFEIEPVTAMQEFIVMLSEKPAHVAARKYSTSQVEKFARAAFGADFAIKKSQEVYLPVYEISVQNQDGTILKTYWNALTGERMETLTKQI